MDSPERGIALGDMPKADRILTKGKRGHPVRRTTESSGASEGQEKTGTYIWHTQGDSKVRSSHADRNGKEFSWNDPPEGGHPGEAFNCRCTAEDVEEKDKCRELQDLMEEAWDTHDQLQDQYLNLLDEKEHFQAELKRVRSMDPREFISDEEYEDTESEYVIGRGGKLILKRLVRPVFDYHQKNTIGEVIKRQKIKDLTEQVNETNAKIVALEKERKRRNYTASEYTRRYLACIDKNGRK